MSTRNFGRRNFGDLWHDLDFQGASPKAMSGPAGDGNRTAARAATSADPLSSGRRRLLPHRLLPHLPAIVAAVIAGLIVALWFAASLGVDDRTASSHVTSAPVVATSPLAAPRDVTQARDDSPPREIAIASEPNNKIDATASRRSTPPPVVSRLGKNGRAANKPRFARQDERELLSELQQMAPVVGLEIDGHAVPNTDVRLKKHLSSKAVAERGFAQLLAANPQLAKLPFLGDDECRTDPKSLEIVTSLSRTVRRLQGSSGLRFQETLSRDLAGEMRGVLHAPAWKRSDAVRTMTQMLQIENDFIRLELVGYLSKIEGPEADRALVDRALFDLSAMVRDDAVAALKKRPLAGYRERLLDAFRHPWPAVARHAADACVELASTDLIADLEAISNQPDPGLAVKNAHGDWIQTEMVRVNHLSNCMFCHPPAERRGKPVGLVAATPSPGEPLPFVYYDEPSEGVQGDTVFLRQDFSVVHSTGAYDPWPAEQRYDYLLRTRPAKAEEIARAESVADDESARSSYPQREAVLFTLSHLSSRP